MQAWERPAGASPPDLIKILSDEELVAYSEGAPYFQRLAAASGCDELKQLLGTADIDQPMFVDLERQTTRPGEFGSVSIFINELSSSSTVISENRIAAKRSTGS